MLPRPPARYRDRTGGDLYADVLAAERRPEVRVVAANEHWTAYVPAAARWPFEVHLAPHRKVPDLPALYDAERDAFGPLYLDLLRRFDGLFDMPMPYISAWHQAVVRRGPRAGLPAPAAVQHPAGRRQAEVPGRLRVRDGRLRQRHRPGSGGTDAPRDLVTRSPFKKSGCEHAFVSPTSLNRAQIAARAQGRRTAAGRRHGVQVECVRRSGGAGGPGQGPPQGRDGRRTGRPRWGETRGEPTGARDKAAASAGDPSVATVIRSAWKNEARNPRLRK